MKAAVTRRASAWPQRRIWNIIGAAADIFHEPGYRRAGMQGRIADIFVPLAGACVVARLQPLAPQ